MGSMMLGRLALGPPWVFHEAVGDPVTNLGGAAIPAPRQALRHEISIATNAPDNERDLLIDRFRIRRGLRSLLNNTPLKLQCFLYVQYTDDQEHNGWYVPDFGQLADIDASAGLATGVWQLEQVAWIVAGHKRTNREARNIWMKDLRTGLAWRDVLKWIYLTDFYTLSADAISYFPHGAYGIKNAVSGATIFTVPLPVGRDGGIVRLAGGLQDLACISFERQDIDMRITDVILYDRRGLIIGPFYLNTIIADNPVSYYRLDETSGTVAYDLQGNNNGTYSGSVLLNQTGALVGGGDNDASINLNYVGGLTIYNPQGLNSSQFTWEGWIKQTTSGTGQTIISALNGFSGFYIYVTAANTLTAQLYYPGGSSTILYGSAGNISTNTWYHVVLSYDGNIANLYLNGVLIAQQNTKYLPAPTGSTIELGELSYIDEVAFYNYCLSPTQIANHYASGVSYDGGNQWEEAYGPDYQWSWYNNGGITDCPVLSNGLCRIRYDISVGTLGFKIDVWTPNGTTNGTAGWVEQGKLIILRVGDSTNVDINWVSASVSEWTPERGVFLAVIDNPTDVYSQESVYITLERGWRGPRIEVYPSSKAAGGLADIALWWYPTLGDSNDSIMKNDVMSAAGGPGTAAIQATAGSGSQLFSGYGDLGASDFSNSENYVSLLRCPAVYSTAGGYQTNIAVLQSNYCLAEWTSNNYAYGSNDNVVGLLSFNYQGYLSAQFSFAPVVSDQVIEAESIINSGSSTTVVTTDATASGGHAVSDSQNAGTNATLNRGTNTLLNAKYRAFARVKIDSHIGATAQIALYLGPGELAGGVNSTVTQSMTSWTWIDLGDAIAVSGDLSLWAWTNTAGVKIYIDRIEMFLLEDKLGTPLYDGARDLGSMVLYDSRQLGALVNR